jgi:hypothetical protein
MSNTASKHTNQLIMMPAIIHGQSLRSDDDFCKNQLGGGVQMSKAGKNHKLSDTQFINSMSKPTSKHTNQLVMMPATKYVQWLRPGAHFWKNRLGGGAKFNVTKFESTIKNQSNILKNDIKPNFLTFLVSS